MKVCLYPPSWELAIECCRRLHGHGRVLEDFKRLLVGTAGEVAASVFLTGCDTAFRETYAERLRVNKGHETPDLERFPFLEIKTIPHGIPNPHFAIAPAGVRSIKITDYLVLQADDETAMSFEVLGWMPASHVCKLHKNVGGWFPSGSPMLPTECLFPAVSCPWRERAS